MIISKKYYKFFQIILILIFCFSSLISYGQAQQWKVWNTSNSKIPTNLLANLYIDSKNVVWIGSTDAGLIKFDGKNFTSFNLSNSPIKSNFIPSMAADKNENLWICAFRTGAGQQGALMKFDRNNNWSFFNTQNSGIHDGNLTAVSVDTNNIVWCFHTKLNKYDGKTWKYYDSTNSPLKYSSVNEIYTDRLNNKWIGQNFYGLFKLGNDSIWTFYNPSNSGIGGVFINKIREDNFNNLWITQMGYGLTRFNIIENLWTNWTPQNSNMHSGRPFGLCIDNSNKKWVGFDNYDSLAEFDNNVFNYHFQPSIITDIKQDKFGNLWLTTDNGLIEYNKNGIVGIQNQNSIIPTNFKIEKIYPNPFNPSTKIFYSLKKSSGIELKLFDASGRFVKLIQSGFKPAGSYELNFSSEGLSSGVYFISLFSDGILADAKKAVLLK